MRITILDEVSCILEGFHYDDFKTLQDSVKFRSKSAFMSSAYKMDLWDGKTSMLDDDGFCYNLYLDDLCETIETQTTINPDDIEIVDERLALTELPSDIHIVPVDYLAKETGYPEFRKQQHEAIQNALFARRGVMELATNFGKTIFCLAISKRLDPYLKTLIVTPSEQLARQTAEEYEKSDLNYCFVHSKMSKKKRIENINNHRHIIITSKLFGNCVEMFKSNEYAFIIDECHIFGEVFQETIRLNFGNTQMCWGLTGTLPHDDKLKMQTIYATIGAGLISYVSTKEMTASGYAAKANVRGVIFKHKSAEKFFSDLIEENMYDWATEQNYYFTNAARCAAIAEYLDTLPVKNTLVLSHALFGNKLAELMGTTYIDADTPSITRTEMFNQFKERDDVIQHASFGTSSTGISENRIFRLIMIELGCDRKLLVQSIGRAIRLDGEIDEVEVIDIGSNTKYATKHRKERIKIYKKEGHALSIPFDEIEIGD